MCFALSLRYRRRGRSLRRPSPVERRAIMVLGQDAFQAGSRDLDRGHRLVDQLADAKVLGLGLKVRPARLLRHSEQLSARYNSFTACRTSPRVTKATK